MAVIYRPKHQRQLNPSDPHGGVNCTAYAAAMAFDRATIGGCDVTGEQVRALSNEPHPDPASPGLNIPQIVAVGERLGITLSAHAGGTFATVLEWLRAGRGVLLSGLYSALPAKWKCQASFAGGHAIYVNNVNTPGTALLVYDPLCSTRRYLPIDAIRAYAEAFPIGLRWAATRITPNISPADQIN